MQSSLFLPLPSVAWLLPSLYIWLDTILLKSSWREKLICFSNTEYFLLFNGLKYNRGRKKAKPLHKFCIKMYSYIKHHLQSHMRDRKIFEKQKHKGRLVFFPSSTKRLFSTACHAADTSHVQITMCSSCYLTYIKKSHACCCFSFSSCHFFKIPSFQKLQNNNWVFLRLEFAGRFLHQWPEGMSLHVKAQITLIFHSITTPILNAFVLSQKLGKTLTVLAVGYSTDLCFGMKWIGPEGAPSPAQQHSLTPSPPSPIYHHFPHGPPSLALLCSYTQPSCKQCAKKCIVPELPPNIYMLLLCAYRSALRWVAGKLRHTELLLLYVNLWWILPTGEDAS